MMFVVIGNIIRKSMLAVLVASSALFSVGASAATINLNDEPGCAFGIGIGNNTCNVANFILRPTGMDTSFIEMFTFTLEETSNITISITELVPDSMFFPPIDLNLLDADLNILQSVTVDGMGNTFTLLGGGVNTLSVTGDFDGLDTNIGALGLSTEVSPVPLPAAAWLFVSALTGLFGFRRFFSSEVA